MRRFVAGIDWTNWRIGIAFHDTKIGKIAEINVLPITFYYRYTDAKEEAAE
jgi:hypothetical protein